MCVANPISKMSPKGFTGSITRETKKTNDPNRLVDEKDKSQESSLSERLSKKVRGQIGFGNVRGKIRGRGMSGTINDLRIPL
tara:strand:+ start:267 stop:512 length:246 start_codon:yes stop_codon:yes gene_type:complete